MKTELQRIITNLEVNPIPGRRQLTARILDQLHELQRMYRTAPVVEDKLKCPKCSSEDILTGGPDWAKEFPEVECNSCGECWTPGSSAQEANPRDAQTAPEWNGPGETQHIYTPDYMAMGDCRICGHTYEAHHPRSDTPALRALAGEA